MNPLPDRKSATGLVVTGYGHSRLLYDVYCSLTGVQVQMKFKYAIAFDLISSS